MTSETTTQWHDVHAVHDGIFNTSSGQLINMKKLNPDSIDGWDICKGLAYTARFGGQTTRFYSVAQHSILVMYLAPPELRAAALIHDASEAYLGDVIKPLKVMLGRKYADIEEMFMAVISVKYGVTQKELTAIKEFDVKALEMEHNAFQQGYHLEWMAWWDRNIGTPANVWSPEYAFTQYLKHFVSKFGEDSSIVTMKNREENTKTLLMRKEPHNG